MLPDPWLRRWLPLLRDTAVPHPVLKIGCGIGDDTATLAGAGLSVVGFDLSEAAVAAARLRVPAASLDCSDLRDPFPVAHGSAGAIVASLSLHYFPWAETVGLVERIRLTLRHSGLLLCRLNSTEDRHFGAEGHPEIEPHFYLVDGQPKRFFDEADVDRLFRSGWQVLSKEHLSTRKYVRNKALWEIVLRRSDLDSGKLGDDLAPGTLNSILKQASLKK
ncbi:MAG: methyltransferase domain-containing protein [Rubrivivax sp.]